MSRKNTGERLPTVHETAKGGVLGKRKLSEPTVPSYTDSGPEQLKFPKLGKFIGSGSYGIVIENAEQEEKKIETKKETKRETKRETTKRKKSVYKILIEKNPEKSVYKILMNFTDEDQEKNLKKLKHFKEKFL